MDRHLVELERADLLVVCSIVLELVGEMEQASLATLRSDVLSASVSVGQVAAASA